MADEEAGKGSKKRQAGDSEDEEGLGSPAKKKVKATSTPRTPRLQISPKKSSTTFTKTGSRSGTRSNTQKQAKASGKMLTAVDYEHRRNYHGDAGIPDGCDDGLRWNSPSLASNNNAIHTQQREMYSGAYISTQLAGREEKGVYLATQITLPIGKIRIHKNPKSGRLGKYPHAQQVPPSNFGF
jgi:hypothetical protein